MDQETMNATVFMVFGFAFFMFVIFFLVMIVNRDHREGENRRVMEMREFGPETVRERKRRKFLHR